MFLEILLLIATYLAFKCWQLWSRQGYWDKHGIKALPCSNLLMGNNHLTRSEVASTTKNTNTCALEDYQLLKNEKVYGTYGPAMQPILVVNDPEIVKAITVKDFNHFVDRASVLDMDDVGSSPTDMSWKKQMTNLKGNEWKNVR